MALNRHSAKVRLIYPILSLCFTSVVVSYYLIFYATSHGSAIRSSITIHNQQPFASHNISLNSPESILETTSSMDRLIEYEVSASHMDSIALPIPKSIQYLYNNPPPEPFDICKNIHYETSHMPSVSIIIPSRNESWPNLWRTLESLFKRTPENLLKEIILFDDYNLDEPSPATPINVLLASARYHFPSRKLRILRTKKREGLIRLKNLGVRLSKGEVLVFLESHVEVQKLWLEPLLKRITESPHSIVLPEHDLLDEKTHKVNLLNGISVGAFDCKLTFGWKDPDSKENPYAIETPAMPGGLFAISRKLWNYLGEYDDQSDVWGGENIELSIRAWSCGARMEFIPCSHVAHEFHTKFQYDIPITVEENTHRVAAVWTSPEFRKACNVFPEDFLFTQERLSSVSERLALKKRLKCRDMNWYLENVYKNYPFKKNRLSNNNKNEVYEWARRFKQYKAVH